MTRQLVSGGLALAIALALIAERAAAQTAEPSSLGAAPGEGGSSGDAPGGTEGVLGGRPGLDSPRIPSTVTRPAGPFGLPPALEIGTASEAPPFDLPLYGPLSIPAGADDEGPPDGLTLDQAIDRLVRANLDLRAKFLEIPQAQADILTAGLRANPILFSDVQLVPYGAYSEARPGGPVQYDLNVTYPLDVNHKRRVRVEVATRAKHVLEAQYQDAVRQQVGNLYTAFVDVLSARETIRYARTSVEGLGRLLELTQSRRRAGEATLADVNRIQIQRDSAGVGLLEAEEALREAKRGLAPLLNLSATEAELLELRGTISDQAAPPAPAQELVRMALGVRPDLVAFRLGLQRAAADVRLARAERFSDIFLLLQPYTFQDFAPFDRKSAHAWGIGVSVPLPIYDRNQGNILRARLNVDQTRTELAQLEQQVATDVQQAERRYAVTRQSVERIERDLLPAALHVRNEALQRYQQGEADLLEYLNAQHEYNDLVRQYRDTAIRHRRSMLELNTAVGWRILP